MTIKTRQPSSNQTYTHVTIVSMITTFLNPSKNYQKPISKPSKTLKSLRTTTTIIYSQTLIPTTLNALKNTLNYLIGWWVREFVPGH